MKSSRNGEIPLPFTDVGKSCTRRGIFNISNLSFNIIQENKISANISEFIVIGFIHQLLEDSCSLNDSKSRRLSWLI